MILAFDTYYYDDKAKTVCVQFENWSDPTEAFVYQETVTGISEYVSGEFYKRELPCIVSLLKKIDTTNCKAIIIDGFVVLDDHEKLGLGGYLYHELQGKIPIIGVAKNNFAKINTCKKAVFRGNSQKPLYITGMGIHLDKAAENIKHMDGAFRIPTLLKKVDSLGREINS